MDLLSLDDLRRGFYRLVGALPEDPSTNEHSAGKHDLADEYLTLGLRAAQRWLIENGYHGWITVSDPLEFEDPGAGFGGKRAPLPDDFMQAFGSDRRSALVKSDGSGWGREVDGRNPSVTGDVYWIPDLLNVWVGNRAQPPSGLRLRYHYRHAPMEPGVTIEFPVEARRLIVAEAGQYAREDAWLPGGQDMETKIERAQQKARTQARRVARMTRSPRKMEAPKRLSNRW